MKFYRDGIEYSRSEMFNLLVEQWGEICFLCKQPPTRSDQLNIDHFYLPYSVAKRRGIPPEEYNDISNLRPSHASCNREKQDQVVDSDDWVFVKPVKVEKPTKVAKSPVCDYCNNGEWMDASSQCPKCLLDNSKRRFPKVTQMEPDVCLHVEPWHCKACVTGWVERAIPESDRMLT